MAALLFLWLRVTLVQFHLKLFTMWFRFCVGVGKVVDDPVSKVEPRNQLFAANIELELKRSQQWRTDYCELDIVFDSCTQRHFSAQCSEEHNVCCPLLNIGTLSLCSVTHSCSLSRPRLSLCCWNKATKNQNQALKRFKFTKNLQHKNM